MLPSKEPDMRAWQWGPLLLFVLCVACGSHHDLSSMSQSLTPARASAVERDVRAFASAVAHDVTQEGPAAWRRHFADSPSFFMASEGHLVFPNSASATTGIQDLARTVKHIELNWGEDLRVDPLTPELAAIAAPWHEILVDTAGNRVDETGFFTAIAEYKNGHWQFRNAHWSVAAPPPRASILERGGTELFCQREHTQDAAHTRFSQLGINKVAERADVSAGLAGSPQ